MKPIKRDHANIKYSIAGKGEITLLFVHGSFIDQTWWADQVNYFKHDYTVITLDLPGHGASGKERKDWSVAGFAEDLICLMKELHLKNVILIGHSMGADINLMATTAYREPVIGFIAIENFKNAGTPLPAQYEKQAEEIQRNLATDFANTNEKYARMALLTQTTSPAIATKVVESYRNAEPAMGLATTRDVFKIFETEQKLLPWLKLKLFLINVDYMPTQEEPLKKFTENNYEVRHMPGTCHFPMLENPGLLNTLLDETIARITAQNEENAEAAVTFL